MTMRSPHSPRQMAQLHACDMRACAERLESEAGRLGLSERQRDQLLREARTARMSATVSRSLSAKRAAEARVS